MNRPTYRTALRWLARILRGAGFGALRGNDLVIKAHAECAVALIGATWLVREAVVVDDLNECMRSLAVLDEDNAGTTRGFHAISAVSDSRPIATGAEIPSMSMAVASLSSEGGSALSSKFSKTDVV